MEAAPTTPEETRTEFPPIGRESPNYDKEKRENIFRELTKPEWTRNRIIGFAAAVIVGIALIGSGGGAVILGLAVLAGVGWLIYLQQTSELEVGDLSEVGREAGLVEVMCRRQALEVLNLDEEEDIIQAVTLAGPVLRPTRDDPIGWIEGRKRDIQGKVKPHTDIRWFPWVPAGDGGFGARIQIHNVFALEDLIAFHTRHYDIVDGEFVSEFLDNGEVINEYSTNKIYYRGIENVRLTQDALEIQMGSGRSHRFGIRIPSNMGEDNDDSTQHLSTDRDIAMANRELMEEGKAFERAVNQLRHEYETRHKER